MYILNSYYVHFTENVVHLYQKEQNNIAICKLVFLRLCDMKESLKNFTISEDSFPKFPNTHEKEKFLLLSRIFSYLGPSAQKHVLRERVPFQCQKHAKNINKLHGQNSDFCYVKSCNTYSNMYRVNCQDLRKYFENSRKSDFTTDMEQNLVHYTALFWVFSISLGTSCIIHGVRSHS